MDLAEAYVKQESASLRLMCKEYGMVCNLPMDVCTNNLGRKAETGNKPSTKSTNFSSIICWDGIRFGRGAALTWKCFSIVC